MADIAIPVATIVSPIYDSIGPTPDTVEAADVERIRNGPWTPFGVMLTNGVQADNGLGSWDGGYCVVGSTDPMVVQMAAAEDPAFGRDVFLSATPGAADEDRVIASNGASCKLGQCLPAGPMAGTGATTRYISWEPVIPSEILAEQTADLVKTSDVTVEAVAGVAVTLRANRRYKMHAELAFVVAGGGTSGAQACWFAAAGLPVGSTLSGVLFKDLALPGIGNSSKALASNDPLGDGGAATSATSGFFVFSGILSPTADCTVQIKAAQHTSTANATTFYKGWITAAEI